MPSVNRRPRMLARPRADRVIDALTAAGVRPGVGMLPTIDVPFYGLGSKAFYDQALAAGHTEVTGGAWPCDVAVQDVGAVLYREPGEGVFRLPDGTVCRVISRGDWIHVEVASGDRAVASAALAAFQAAYPPLFLQKDGEAAVMVPITFWMLGQFGPERRLRRVESTDWQDIQGNYAADVQAELDRLTGPDFRPGDGGQLLLWYGPPGTGKTWAIRALANAWAPWAEFDYITDPDAFFVQSASYMVDVLLHESYEAIDEPTGDLVTTMTGEKWRVLILEDTGELLSADAKDRSGQGLSRLLNVVDGMIGQGLRILVLVTTNDEIESLHPAVQRPGRCASKTIFGPLSQEEASAWLGHEADRPMTLAELYAANGDDAFDLADDEPELPAAADDDLDALQQAAVDAACMPLPVLEDEPAADAVAAIVAAAGQGRLTEDGLVSALEAIAASHRTTVEAIAGMVAAGPRGDATAELAALSASALSVIERLASRDPAPPSTVHVHVPEQPVTVNVDGPRIEPRIDVHVPEQAAPVVNVAAPAAPSVDVHVAAPEPAPVHVDVHVPQQPAQPAPVVHVAVPAQPARVVTVIEDPETGDRRFVSRDADPDELDDGQ